MGIKVIKCQCCKGSGVYDQGQCGYCGGVGYIAIEEKPQPVKTLLDEFAKEAMGKLIEISSGTTMPREELGYVYNFISEQAWGFAAAMMKERARRDEIGNVKEVK